MTEVETPLQLLQRDYLNTPDDASLHGRPQSLSTTLNDKTSTIKYEYSTPYSELAGETVLQTVETFSGCDNTQKQTTQQSSLLTGLSVVSTDANDVKTLIRYDALGRKTMETLAPQTDNQAHATHLYILTSTDGGHASEHFTDFKNVQTVTRYDGASRMVFQGIHDPDQMPQAEPRPTYEATYDARGDLIEDTTYDWLGPKKLTLTKQYERDSWGTQRSVKGPEGVSSIREVTPFGINGPRECTWSQSAAEPPEISGLSVSEYNRFGKLDSVRRLDAGPLNARLNLKPARSVIEQVELMLHNEELPTVNLVQYAYDGLGNCVQQDELLDDNFKRTTQFAYDVWGRMHSTKLPDKTSVSRTFAEHSTQEHSVSLLVTPANTSKPEVTTIEQTFDGLLRLINRNVGSRIEEFRYAGGQMQVSQRITPSKKTFEYKYNLDLTAQPISIQEIGKEEITTYQYDQLSSSVTGALNANGNRGYEYTALGHLSRESWTDASGVPKEMNYITSMQGRYISRSHTDGLETFYDYDKEGRVERVTQGDLQADFEYNLLGQPWRTTTRNLLTNSTLISEIEYDSLAREIKRTLIPSAQSVRTITQTWLADDQLKSRHLEMDGRSLLKETFFYDPRNRLQEHRCSGETLPKDTYGNEITEQIFRFDDLDNIERCLTTFKNGDFDDARFTYSQDDRCQLLKVTHSWPEGGYPAERTFGYDTDGNMLNDEQGQRLIYDSYGRLVNVEDPSGQHTLSTYRYDGHDHLVGVREGDEEHETLRFYLGYQLSHTLQGDKHIQYLYDGDRPLGQQQLKDHEQTMLLLTDASPSVIGESLQAGLRTAVYNAYGERSSEKEMQTLLAFNSEVREKLCRWYLLGRGYRAYNPSLMRFHSPDYLSPFEGGGVNPYVYGLGNPVYFRDPTGHLAVNGRPPDDSGTIDKIKTELLGQIGSAIGFVVAAVVAIGLAVPTGGASLSLIGVAAALVTVAGAAVGIYGVFAEDSSFVNIGIIATSVGTLVAFTRPGAIAVRGRMAKAKARKAEKRAAKSEPSDGNSSAKETGGPLSGDERLPQNNIDNQQPFNTSPSIDATASTPENLPGPSRLTYSERTGNSAVKSATPLPDVTSRPKPNIPPYKEKDPSLFYRFENKGYFGKTTNAKGYFVKATV
ncbi:RHS repeat domain-containing protein [Pseudomonas umsongensis]|uniref:RHS repeat domain-containing protein n=1 Tax=Pseudomonas umsongensis TaxID=198618 RepID=UPI001C4B2548